MLSARLEEAMNSFTRLEITSFHKFNLYRLSGSHL